MPRPNGIVPFLDLIRIQIVHDASVVVVPSHCYEFSGQRVMTEHWISRNRMRLVESRRFPGGMSGDGCARQDGVCVGVQLLENRSDIKSIN